MSESLDRPSPASSALAHLSPGPLYELASQRLLGEIRSGALPPGSRLPSERALADALGFARLTIRRCLLELSARGVLEAADPRGWRVSAAPISEPPSMLMSFTDLAKSRGLTASARIVAIDVWEASVDESDALRVAPGSQLTRCVRVRTMDDQPVAVEAIRVSSARHPWISTFDWTMSLHESLRAHGTAPFRSEVFVDVSPATGRDAELLGVRAGTGLLRVEGVTSDAAGMPLTLDEIRYHPTRYRFRAVLEGREPTESNR